MHSVTASEKDFGVAKIFAPASAKVLLASFDTNTQMESRIMRPVSRAAPDCSARIYLILLRFSSVQSLSSLAFYLGIRLISFSLSLI